MNKYSAYNREERNLCSHLFRLLHHNLEKGKESTLAAFIKKSSSNDFGKLKDEDFQNAEIFSEVALLRDAYKVRKRDFESLSALMHQIVDVIKEQMSKTDVLVYSDLPDELKNPKHTHPRQLKSKVAEIDGVSKDTKDVYKVVTSAFNAKPDMCICIGNYLLVFEAKFTEGFKNDQMERSELIAKIWQKVLYQDLGFTSEPETQVLKLGADRFAPCVSWKDVLEIAEKVYPASDRSRQAFEAAVNMVKK